MLADRNIDAVVVILMRTPETGKPSYDFLVELAQKYPAKPVYVTFMGAHALNVEAKAYLDPRGVPCYMLVEEPFEVLAALARCRAHGYRLVHDQPRPGAGGRRVAFVHPKSTSGILLELTE